MATAPCCCSQASRRFRKVVRATFRATWWPKGSFISSWFCSPAKDNIHVQYQYVVIHSCLKRLYLGEWSSIFCRSWVCLRIVNPPQSPKKEAGKRDGSTRLHNQQRGREEQTAEHHGPNHPLQLKFLLNLNPLPNHSAIWSEGIEGLERPKRHPGTHPAQQQFPSGPPRMLHSR